MEFLRALWFTRVLGPIRGWSSNQTSSLKLLAASMKELPQPGQAVRVDGSTLLYGCPVKGDKQTVSVSALTPHSGWKLLGYLVFKGGNFSHIIWPAS